MAWDTGTITSATPWASLSQKVKDLISGGSGIANWSFVKNIPAGTGAGQSGSASYSLDLFLCRGAANYYKRAVQLNLASSQITTDGTSFAHTVTTPAASRFITVCVINTKASAADDPTGVTLNGSNAPTFTKIKSQAGGNAGEIKMTLWIGKSTASAPTGTQLTAAFGSTQTGCMVIVDQWDGCDLTLLADGLDNTGATEIGLSVAGNNGDTQTAHGVTMSSYLGAQSVSIIYAAETGSSGTYTNKAGWSPLAADLAMATPTTHGRGAWRPNTNNTEIDTAPNMVLSSSASETSWCAIGFEFQRTTQSTSITNANDAGRDFYFVMEIPVSDGAVNSSLNAFEDYDGNELFRRAVSTATTATPDGFDFSTSPTLAQYASVTSNNRASTTHQTLNTTGFGYWIKITPNGIMLSTRVGAGEKTNAALLLDSFITNVTDMPLVFINSAVQGGNTFSRLPGVTISVTTGWQVSLYPWTQACGEGFTTNASNQQDLWISAKVHAARIFVAHTAGRAAGNSGANDRGYARGLIKSPFRCIRSGGTVQLGDTMNIDGTTYTVIGTAATYGSTGATSIVILTQAS